MVLQWSPVCAEMPKSARSEKAISSWTPKLETALEAYPSARRFFSVSSKLKAEKQEQGSYKPLLKTRMGFSSFLNLGIFAPILARLGRS